MSVRGKTPFTGVRRIVLAAGIAGMAALCLSGAVAQAAQTTQGAPATERIVQWRKGIAAEELKQATIVRITHDFHAADLATLHDDQTIETPSGKRVSVKAIRGIENAIAAAKARPLSPDDLQLLPGSKKPCTPAKPGETYAQILARPDTDVVCLHAGEGMSVAQLRALKSYVERTRGVSIVGGVPVPPSLSGPATTITDNKQLATLLQTTLKDAPDSTVLVNPKGQRITLGSVRAAVKVQPELLVRPFSPTQAR